MCAQKQMLRVYAKGRVAFMANAESIRHLAIGKLPSYAVSASFLAVNTGYSIPKAASFKVGSALPKPALIWPRLFYLVPEVIRRFLQGLMPANQAAKLSFGSYRARGVELKFNAALFACSCYRRSSHDLRLLRKSRLWLGSFTVSSSVRAACILALVLCFTPHVNAQSPQQQEIQKLQTALGDALDKLTDLEKRLEGANAALNAALDERRAAEAERDRAKAERESLERSVKYATEAIAAQQKVIDTYQNLLIPAMEKLVDRHEARISDLEVKVDRANGRVIKSGLIGFIAGVAAGLVKIF